MLLVFQFFIFNYLSELIFLYFVQRCDNEIQKFSFIRHFQLLCRILAVKIYLLRMIYFPCKVQIFALHPTTPS